MRTSSQNMNSVRPTVTFYYVVVGWRDGHGKDRVTRTEVRTSRKDAVSLFTSADIGTRGFVRLYSVAGRTLREDLSFFGHRSGLANPQFESRLIRERQS